MCGGTRSFHLIPCITSGLSPRVRGNRPQTPQVLSNHRVYPRVCGGTHGRMSHVIEDVRSIPACAGEPDDVRRPPGAHEVYPRVCGGTYTYVLKLTNGTGLSPRVRGNLQGGVSVLVPRGSIPACAGEPPGACGGGRKDWVYPRVCGGTCPDCPVDPSHIGLSPRVRGNLVGFGIQYFWLRSIPACAGEPHHGVVSLNLFRVYPRVCGGTAVAISAFASVTGLSPRVRGNLRQPTGT